jgi:hypothetical protein
MLPGVHRSSKPADGISPVPHETKTCGLILGAQKAMAHSVSQEGIRSRKFWKCPLSTAVSVGHRNTRFKTLGGSFKAECLAWSPIKLTRDFVQAFL